VNPALLFLVVRSARNSLRGKVRRLRSFRYLVPTILGAAYFFVVFDPLNVVFRRQRGPAPLPDPGTDLFVEWGFVLVSFLLAASAWVLPSSGSPLAFTEAEAAHLFPAPLSRGTLVRYKLIEMQKALLLLPLIFGLLNLGKMGPARAAFICAGGWLSLNALSLHGIAAKLTRKSLLDHGASGFRRQALPLLLLGGYLLFVVLGAPPLPGWENGPKPWARDMEEWLRAFGESPSGLALAPFRIVARTYLAQDGAEFALRMAVLVPLVGLLFAWVLRTDTAFEEEAVDQAAALARRVEAAKKGKMSVPVEGARARRNPWKIGPEGLPEVTFLWKSVGEALRGLSPKLLAFLIGSGAIAVVLGIKNASRSGPEDLGAKIVAVACLAIAGLTVFWGPGLLGSTLRKDMERIDVLKSLPLAGGRIVRCSLVATVVPVAVLQALLFLVGVLLLPGPSSGEVTPAWRLAAALGGIAALPALTLLSAGIDAGLVIWFPAWFKPGSEQAGGGFEGMGGNIVGFLLKGIAYVLGAAIPFGLAGLGVALAVRFGGPAAGPPAAVAGAFAATGIVLAEAWFLSEVLGRRFDGLDPAEEGLAA
jgi:ABC-2 type transport system permease protein